MPEPEEIVLWKLKDLTNDQEMNIKTAFITREQTITRDVKVPLYVDGVIIPDANLANLQLERVGYTQTELDVIHYANLYQYNPDLETRVRQYKDYLDQLGLDYDAGLDDIMSAISASETITDKALFGLQVNITYEAIITNMEFMGFEQPHMETYTAIAKLIQYLPVQ